MTDFRGNIDHWLRQADPDYYLFFLKAWIPFNAWYVAELPQLNRKDSKIIKELQNNPGSKPRRIIETFLSNEENNDARRYRAHLADLHIALEANKLSHRDQTVSFSTLSLGENPKKFEKDSDINGYVYKAEVKPSFLQALIVEKGGKTILDFKQPKFDLEALKRFDDFIRIGDKKIQSKIVKCFEEINPQKPINLVSQSKTKGEFIQLVSDSKVNFINDPTTIAKACLQILYFLRCMLFHGEIEPINPNRRIYEHGYNLLSLIIKKLQ